MGACRKRVHLPPHCCRLESRLVGVLMVCGVLVVGMALPAAALPTVASSAAGLRVATKPAAVQPLALLLSTDGVTYSETLPRGLFDQAGAVVPRQVVAAELWVKNPSTAPATFRLSAHEVTVSDSGFAQALTLSTWESVSNTVQVTPVTQLLAGTAVGECAVVVPEQPVPSGRAVRLRVTVAMADVAELRAQQRLNLNFLAAMRDADGGAFPPSACRDEGALLDSGTAAAPEASGAASARAPWLASTGVNGLLPWLSLGALSLGVGAAMLRRVRAR